MLTRIWSLIAKITALRNWALHVTVGYNLQSGHGALYNKKTLEAKPTACVQFDIMTK